MGEYRQTVRPRLPKSYDGQKHLATLLCASTMGIIVPLIWLNNPSWMLVLTVVPICLLYANFVEYIMHRYVAHVIKWTSDPLKTFRKYHAIVHHSFFCDDEWTIDSTKDIFFVLFPGWIYILWAVMGMTPIFMLNFILGSTEGFASSDTVRNAWLLASSTGSFVLLQYEFLHSFNHRALPGFIQTAMEAWPIFQRVQAHHRLHHLIGKCNFCITWPLSDIVFGTYK